MWLPIDEEEKELQKIILNERIEDRETFERLDAFSGETNQIFRALLITGFALKVAKKARKLGGKVGLIQGLFLGALGFWIIQSYLNGTIF